jgi:GT2 family glycosyltransferase
MSQPNSVLSPQRSALLSVIIPNWNGGKFLPTCLDALARQTHPAVEVIVVDNASHDGSQELIRTRYPDVRLIELPENRGFTGACNAGLRAAQGDFVALLNNDTEVDSGWAAAVVDAFGRHPEAGIVASKMLLFDRRDHIHTAGDYFTTDGRAGNRGVWEQDSGQYDREEYVFSACGGSSAYRKATLDQIGLLDDDFFFSLEDVDLAWRAQLAGWRCLYTPAAIVYHHLSATGGGVTASYYDGRNLIWLLTKNVPGPLWRKYGLRMVQAQLRLAWEALRAWRGAAARARLRGMLAGLAGLPRMWRKRRAVQGMRAVPVDYIESILTPAKPAPVMEEHNS